MTMRDDINRKVIEVLKSKSVVPWQQPWTDAVSTMPVNVLTGIMYRDINPILLRIGDVEQQHVSKWWGTEAQWKLLGGRLLPNAKGVEVCTATDKPCLVYNSDCVGGDFGRLRRVPNVQSLTDATDAQGTHLWTKEGRNIKAEKVIKAIGADFREQHCDVAQYHRPPLDYIILPLLEQFRHGRAGVEGYYSTAFHELCHYSEAQMGWLADPGRSVKERYALGEWRSEICSAYLCAACGIPPLKNDINFDPRSNYSVYLKHWLRMMSEDSSMVFRIAKAASDAVTFLLAKSKRGVCSHIPA